MDIVLLLLRLGLGLIFAVAGIAKLADLPGSRRAVAAYGVPRPVVPVVGTALPVLEVALAVLLLPSGTAPYAAAGLLVLSLVFAAVVGTNLRRGNAPDCHCFGALHSDRASWHVVGRDVGLAALAAVIVAGGSSPRLTRLADRGWSGAPAASTIVLALACGYLLVERRRALARVAELEAIAGNGMASLADDEAAGLPPGSAAPAFELATIDGLMISLEQLRARGYPLLLVFSDPACDACHELLGHVGRWQREVKESLSIVVLSAGPRAANRPNGFDLGDVPLLVQQAQEVADAYRVSATPTAVVVSPDGLIACETVGGGQAIRDLVLGFTGHSRSSEQAPADGAVRLLPPLVRRVPAIQLRGLDGAVVDLRRLFRQRTVVLFWDPESEHCRRIRHAMDAVGGGLLIDGSALLVVSSRRAPAAAEDELHSQALIDETALIGRAIGVLGTPAAVVVEKGGAIHSPISIGTAAVLGLLQPGVTDRAAAEERS